MKNPVLTLMKDPDITEIMINSFDHIFIEKSGHIHKADVSFDSKKEYSDFIEQLMVDEGIDPTKGFFFDGAISGRYRYNIVLPPMNPGNPLLTIRKFSTKMFTLETLVELGSISSKAKIFLERIVKAKMNVIVSGGTGSGKTTFLQALSSEIPGRERIVTVEDVPELNLHQENWVQLLSVRRGRRKVSIKDCLINSLRMRPDRILVGECRRDETFEMLQAMNTGHEGSMTTVHANNPVDCLTRLENLLHSAGFDVEPKYIRKQIAETIHFIVQLQRRPDGTRCISQIVEVTGTEGDMITRSDIFLTDATGQLVPRGLVPKTVKIIEKRTESFAANFFK